jgi:SAM-dependent methyltransferase
LADPLRVVRILDFGCGVGNAAIPLMEKARAKIEYLGMDISLTAVGILREKLQSHQRHVTMARPLDLVNCTEEAWSSIIEEFASLTAQRRGFDFCLMIFTVSAFPPAKMLPAIRRACNELTTFGSVCFRDYLKGDMTEQRFAHGQRLGRNLCVRQDGTLSFFFSEVGLLSLFEEVGSMRTLWIKPIKRLVENRGSELKMFRSWLGAEIVKT